MVTVVGKAYDLSGNGGRKLVRLGNGKQVAGVKVDSSGFILFIRDNDTAAWRTLYTMSVSGLTDIALLPINNDVFVVYSYGGTIGYLYLNATTGEPSRSGAIEVALTAVGNVTLAVDPTNGHLHAAWAYKNATLSKSFNIGYAKSINLGSTWAVEKVTSVNQAYYEAIMPSITVQNSQPLIAVTSIWGNSSSDSVALFSKTVGTAGGKGTANGWRGLDIYNTGYSMYGEEPSLILDKNGVLHVTFATRPYTGATSYKNIHYGKSTDGGLTWTITTLTNSTSHYTSPSITIDKDNRLFVAWYAQATARIQIREFKGNAWQTAVDAAVGGYPSTLYDPYFMGSITTTPALIYQASASIEYIGAYTTNAAPTVAVTSPIEANTLYENDIFAIAGSVTDTNSGDVVSVKYSIDGGTAQAITAIVSNGSASSFAKNLTYKNGALYDGATAITGQLAEGSQHNIKIWAEDDKGGKSSEIVRSFYVVPNRAATLTLDAFVTRNGLINTDVVNISGKVADLDNGNVIVKYKIGNGAFVQVYNGPASATPTSFNFNILLADLSEGQNAITIQAVDAYNAITQVVLNLKKEAVEQPLLNAVTYYEIMPPNGTTDGLQLYVERELGDLVVNTDVFMGANGETEVFVPMTLASTANLTNGNVEDTFSYQHTGDATKVVVRINMARTSAATNKAIKKISGVLT